jgi:hypothetical protein
MSVSPTSDLPPAPPSTEAPHSCQPPQTDLPSFGTAWTCPECGRRWKLEDVSELDEKGGPSQRMYWAVEGPPPEPKDEGPPTPTL